VTQPARPATVRFYFDADILGLGKTLARLQDLDARRGVDSRAISPRLADYHERQPYPGAPTNPQRFGITAGG
jgi:hypothetical protein